MIDYYLKFASEDEAKAVLYTVTPAVLNEEGEVVTEEQVKPNYMNIDVLGVLYEKQEIVDPENPPEPVPLDGWHVNVRLVDGEDGNALQPFAVVPTQPRRVWA